MKKLLPRLTTYAKGRALRACLRGDFDPHRILILTSSPRSGSTLLENVLGAIPRSGTLFEPLHLTEVPQAKAAGFDWRTFVAADEHWPIGEKFLRNVFRGQVVNDWTAREMSFREACQVQRLIVKFVRANRLLPWICCRFEVPPPVLLLRHPCAVVASQLKYGWENTARPDPPQFIKTYPNFLSALAATNGVEEFLAARWALDQLVPLLHQHPHPWTIVTYEELIRRPTDTLNKILSGWNVDMNMDEALTRFQKPSSVVAPSGISGINGWKKQLTGDQINRVMRTVNAFGIDFYSLEDESDDAKLHDDELPAIISAAGKGN